MEPNDQDIERRVNGSRVGTGVFLLLAGFLLLAYKMGAPIPGWLFTWPVLLIAIGLLTAIKSRFHNPGSYILILVGGVFSCRSIYSGHRFTQFYSTYYSDRSGNIIYPSTEKGPLLRKVQKAELGKGAYSNLRKHFCTS